MWQLQEHIGYVGDSKGEVGNIFGNSEGTVDNIVGNCEDSVGNYG